ncbi:hypothetical protein C8R43DRAFT_960534 [Mycena crocata]|nr:hypothetical protein C8R43DRAFT_960534 [Mycena crocata]
MSVTSISPISLPIVCAHAGGGGSQITAFILPGVVVPPREDEYEFGAETDAAFDGKWVCASSRIEKSSCTPPRTKFSGVAVPQVTLSRFRCVELSAKGTIGVPEKGIQSIFWLSGTSPRIGVYISFLTVANHKFRHGFSLPKGQNEVICQVAVGFIEYAIDTGGKDPRTAREGVFRVFRREDSHLNGDVLVGIARKKDVPLAY